MAFILAGEMAFAYFIGHMFKTGAPVWHPLINGGTAAILFCFACLYLSTAGGGPYSLDATMRRSSAARSDSDDTVIPASESMESHRSHPGMTSYAYPGSFSSSGTAASYFELCSTSEVLTLRTCGAAVRCVTKS